MSIQIRLVTKGEGRGRRARAKGEGEARDDFYKFSRRKVHLAIPAFNLYTQGEIRSKVSYRWLCIMAAVYKHQSESLYL